MQSKKIIPANDCMASVLTFCLSIRMIFPLDDYPLCCGKLKPSVSNKIGDLLPHSSATVMNESLTTTENE